MLKTSPTPPPRVPQTTNTESAQHQVTANDSANNVESTDDIALLSAWSKGHQPAGNTLIRRHYRQLFRFFEKRASAPDDLTQRVFLAALEGWSRFAGRASFRSYLFGIARRVLLGDIDRRSRSLETTSGFEDNCIFGGPTVTTLLSEQERHHALFTALASLDEQAQTLLRLFYWDALKAREVAQVLGIPTSTVTTRLGRARRKLSTAFFEYFAESPSEDVQVDEVLVSVATDTALDNVQSDHLDTQVSSVLLQASSADTSRNRRTKTPVGWKSPLGEGPKPSAVSNFRGDSAVGLSPAPSERAKEYA